jgi:YHS domain-containing protein
MMKTIGIISAVAGAALFTTAAMAATGEYDNMCAMGLALEKKVETDCSVNAEIDGKTYCFGNEQAKELFMKDPEANLAKADSYYEKAQQ